MLGKLKKLWEDNRTYFYVGCLLLISGVLIGYTQADKVESIALQMLSQIKELANKIGSSNNPSAAFGVIFLNNVTSSVLMMILGVLFAVFPIYGLVANGILLGYFLQKMGGAGHTALQMFAIGILPHGIIELPAVIFAAGIGIRYGVLTVRTFTSVWSEKSRNELKIAWIQSLKQFPLAVATVILLLGMAAFIESVVTPILIRSTIGNG